MPSSEPVVPLFRRPFVRDVVPETPLPTMAGFGQSPRAPVASSMLDLSGKPKVWMLIGPGGSGKTLLARWLCWRMTT